LVNPATGSSSRLATGFAAAPHIGVAGDGTTYVAELFGGKISKVTRNGAVSTFTEVGTPLSVEVRGGFVYAATAGIFGPGRRLGRPVPALRRWHTDRPSLRRQARGTS